MSNTAFTVLTSVKRRDFSSVQRLFTLNLLLPSQMVPDGLYADGHYTVTNDLVGELLQACAPTLLHGKIEVPREVSAWDGLQPAMPQDLTIDIALLNRRYHNEGSPLQLERMFSASAELYTSNGKLFSSYAYEAHTDHMVKRYGMCDIDLAVEEGRHIVTANNYIFDGVSAYSRQMWTNKGVAGDHMSREKAKVVAAICSGVATKLAHETVADEV
jgi:hypothetical protein